MMSTPRAVASHAHSWLALAVLALAYYAINFVLTPNSLSPIHQDDYLALGYGFEEMRWSAVRPVSSNLIFLMGAMGPPFAYLLLSAMTVALVVLVVRLSERIFQRELKWYALLLVAAVAFGHMASYEHGKLLGLATTLSSNVLGLVAMCLLWDAWKTRSANSAMAGIVAYALAVFAKEDYILPPLVMLAWLWLMRLREAGSWREALRGFEIGLTVAALLAALASVVYTFVLSSNPFVGGLADAASQNASYAVNLAPKALLTALWTLTFGYAPLQSGIGIVSLIAGFVLLPALRWQLALIAGLILVLMLPYAAIPNNMPEFRVFGWLPWFGALAAFVIVFAAEALARRIKPSARGALSAVLALALAALVMWQANPHRQAVAAWYAAQQQLNNRMIESLRDHRSLIAREATVGITGVEGLSPWSNTDAQFLHRKLYFDNKWIVFVDKDSMFFQIDPVVAGKPVPSRGKEFVLVESTSHLCDTPSLLVLQFDAGGAARPVRAGNICAATPAPVPVPAK